MKQKTQMRSVRVLNRCGPFGSASHRVQQQQRGRGAGSDVFEEHRPCGDSFAFEGTRGVVSDLLLYGAASTTAAQGSHH